MYYSIKFRQPTSSKGRLYRKEGKIVVYCKETQAKAAKKELEDKGMFAVTIVQNIHSPAQRENPLFGRSFELK